MKNRFEVLDIFRGIFSAMVVFFHMSAFTNTPVINNNFVNNSDLFVDFFFVLSGFVIAYSYRGISSTDKLQQFLKKRWMRIYPLHFVMLLIFVVIEITKHFFVGHIQINNLNNTNNNWMSFISTLFLLNAVKMPGVHDVSWNIPGWSISAEMISYVFFGSLMLLLFKIKKEQYKNYFAAAIVLAAIAIVAMVKGNGILNYSYDFGFLRGVAGFFTGMLCMNVFTACKNRINNLPASFFHFAECMLLLCTGFFIYEGETFKQVGFIYLILFFLSVFIFSFEKGFVSGLLKQSGILKRMGQYSYSIYMTHALLLSLFNIVFIRLLHLPASAYTWLFALNYLLIYKVSEWTYKHIEMRFAGKSKATKSVQKEVVFAKEIATAL
ncbi:acyltransferase [Ilyomonas limi]|uniref:Acyltransferase n=1 Tax=Ilyomonas limi TaxID=2575867 RepID=A0A4U3KV34_9BACT|nr:acyltransferase [Ilyomonas limi]TKK65679.1 acyltransferase [Ilyomonas limi]